MFTVQLVDVILCMLGNFSCFLLSANFFKNNLSRKNSFRNNIGLSNMFYPDQAQHFVRSDLGPNCLQRYSADNTIKQRVKVGVVFGKENC